MKNENDLNRLIELQEKSLEITGGCINPNGDNCNCVNCPFANRKDCAKLFIAYWVIEMKKRLSEQNKQMEDKK